MTTNQVAANQVPKAVSVRPYVLSGGRTETSPAIPSAIGVKRSDKDQGDLRHGSPEKLRILDSTGETISVGELANQLAIPVQVVKVLVGQLLSEGFLTVEGAHPVLSPPPDLRLLQRVLNGVREK